MYYILYHGKMLSSVLILPDDDQMGSHCIIDCDESMPLYFENISDVWRLLSFLSSIGPDELYFEIKCCEV